MHSVIETSVFRRHADQAGVTETERFEIIQMIAGDPMAGDLIPGTGGARKVRVAGRSKGKSGGYRVITYFAAEDVPMFLLDIYAKNEKVNLTKSEANELKEVLKSLADDWRASVRRSVVRLEDRR